MDNGTLVGSLIPLLPIAGFLLLVFWGRYAPKSFAAVSTLLLAVSTQLSIQMLFKVGESQIVFEKTWFALGGFSFNLGLSLDKNSLVIIAVITVCSLLTHIYSIGYLGDRKDQSKYFAFLALITSALISSVISPNMFQFFISGTVASSAVYGLSNLYSTGSNVGKKNSGALITLVAGDAALLIAIVMMIFSGFQTLAGMQVTDISGLIEESGIDVNNPASLLSFSKMEYLFYSNGFVRGFEPFLLPFGALIGFYALCKSAQFPFHSWLTKTTQAMIPANAVFNGLFVPMMGLLLLFKMNFVFTITGQKLLPTILFSVGVFTTLLAASSSIFQSDLKKAYAYSTVALGGFILCGISTGITSAIILQLLLLCIGFMLLLLCCGEIYRNYGSLDTDFIDGVFTRMKGTGFAMVVGSLALCLIPLISAIILPQMNPEGMEKPAFTPLNLLFVVNALIASLSLFKPIFKMSRMTNIYEPASGTKPLEVVPVLLFTLLALFGSTITVLLIVSRKEPFLEGCTQISCIAGMVATIAGIALSWITRTRSSLQTDSISRVFAPLCEFFHNGWYWEPLFENGLGLLASGVSISAKKFETKILSELVHSVSKLSRWLGYSFRQLHTGSIQMYLFTMAIALLVLIFIFNLIRFS